MRLPLHKINLILLALAVLGSGCVRHIAPYKPKVRKYKPHNYAASHRPAAMGSLYQPHSQGLFEDARARREGDIINVRIDERSDATRDASTKAGRSNKIDLGVSSFMTAMLRIVENNPNLTPAELIKLSSSSNFEGKGSTTRSGQLTAVLPVQVIQRLSNGDFFVEGHKVLLLNDEESHLYLSGVVRAIDILPDNSVSSSQLADVELEFTGRGVLTAKQSPGWLSTALDYIWPF